MLSILLSFLSKTYAQYSNPAMVSDSNPSQQQKKITSLEEVELFGDRHKQPDKLDAITRLPLSPSQQVQSISVISHRLIEMQGVLTISDALKNVPGVYTFATYGNRSESIGGRGYRGLPLLKNGVRVSSDARGYGFITDMQGVDNIQVLKGASSITQGFTSDIGSPGGVINIVTKTPQFIDGIGGNIGLRLGHQGLAPKANPNSWQVRPTFDVYGSINKAKTLAFRVDGAFENNNSYRKGVSMNRMYINPSLEWRPDNKTSFILEMDYLDDSRTPDPGTVNLSAGLLGNDVYEVPLDINLGWNSNRSTVRNVNYSFRFNRMINNHLTIRAAYFQSNYNTNVFQTILNQFINNTQRRITKPLDSVRRQLHNREGKRDDKNHVFQVDLIGKDIKTGNFSHTFQAGMDYRLSNLAVERFEAATIDTINIRNHTNISNELPRGTKALKSLGTDNSSLNSVGALAQYVLSFKNMITLFLAGRYTVITSQGNVATARQSGAELTGIITDHGFNPMVGIIVSPVKHMHLFASFTNSTTAKRANVIDVNGNVLKGETSNQIETGIKTEFFDNALRINLTGYWIRNTGINLRMYKDSSGILNQTSFFFKGGNDDRKGIELEVVGKILPNLEVVGAYSYIDARYKEHSAFVKDSKPANTPDHTASLWLSYTFPYLSSLKGLSLSAGGYYISSRPFTEYSRADVNYVGVLTAVKPWEFEGYVLVNAQIAYQYKNYGVRFLLNNALNSIGYSNYRNVYINRIDPINWALQLNYHF